MMPLKDGNDAECARIQNVSHNQVFSSSVKKFVASSAGGWDNPRVGLSKDICTTSSSKPGSCVPLIHCRNYWKRNVPDLTNSSCGEKTAPKVCCPLSEDDETTMAAETPIDEHFSLTSTTTLPTTTNLPQMNSTKRSWRSGSSFPTNCGHSGATLRRIVGGQDAALGAWPWMAAIYLIRRGVKNQECGGVLITASHVLTAAHCTVTSRRGQAFSSRQLLVRLGDLDLNSDNDGANPIDVGVRTVIRHEFFSIRTFQNDIAILVLQQSVQISNQISPICLPFNVFQGEDLAERRAIVTGWGSSMYGGPGITHLQEVQLRIWRNEVCREVFRRHVPITDANLCAGDGDKDACRGDSGGPLKLADSSGTYYLIGLISFGKRCAEAGIPGVFTRITTYLNWLDQNIG